MMLHRLGCHIGVSKTNRDGLPKAIERDGYAVIPAKYTNSAGQNNTDAGWLHIYGATDTRIVGIWFIDDDPRVYGKYLKILGRKAEPRVQGEIACLTENQHVVAGQKVQSPAGCFAVRSLFRPDISQRVIEPDFYRAHELATKEGMSAVQVDEAYLYIRDVFNGHTRTT